jgi:electron transfer flavoprotein alpha subunit
LAFSNLRGNEDLRVAAMANEIFILIEHFRGQLADITYVMAAAARSISGNGEVPIVGVLLGQGVKGIVSDLGVDRVLSIEDSALEDFTADSYLHYLENLISTYSPRVLLVGDTSIGSDVAGVLSKRLNIPLVSSCKEVVQRDGELGFLSRIYGGKIMAEGKIPSPIAIISMIPGGYKPEQGQRSTPPEIEEVALPAPTTSRLKVKEYIDPEPGDVDISTVPCLVAVGRGIQREDNLELASELAQALGGVVCASRPIVDQGWLSTSRMVGKSGKAVKPDLYLALGISGAPEHVEAITASGAIIAINTDRAAPIYEIAKYGAEVDILELIPVLTEKVLAARGG